MTKFAPTNPVTIPMGISYGDIIVQTVISAHMPLIKELPQA